MLLILRWDLNWYPGPGTPGRKVWWESAKLRSHFPIFPINPDQMFINPDKMFINPDQMFINPDQMFIDPDEMFINPD